MTTRRTARSRTALATGLSGLLAVALLLPQTGVSAAEPLAPTVAAEEAAVCGGLTSDIVTAADAARFSRLWVPRVVDSSFAARYVDSATATATIQDEGFHSRPEADRRVLASCLLDALVAAGQQAPADDAERAQTVSVLEQYVFEPAAMKADSDATAPTADPAGPPASVDTGDQAGPADPQEQARETVAQPLPAQALDAAATVAAPDLAPALPADSVDATALTTIAAPLPASPQDRPLAGLGAQVPAERSQLLTALGGTGAAQLAQVDRVVSRVATAAGELVDTVLADRLVGALRASDLLDAVAVPQRAATGTGGRLPGGAALAGVVPPLPPLPLDPLAGVTLPLGLPSATYRLCAESATRAAACSATLPLGVPAVVDVTGDGSFDAVADLLPTVDPANPTSLGLRFLDRRLPTSEKAGQALQAHLFVLYDLPSAQRRLALGYDGFRRGSTLPEMTDTTFSYDLAAARDGVLDVRAAVSQTAPGASFANTAALTTITSAGGDADPTVVSAQLSPVPSTYSAHLRQAGNGSQTVLETVLDRSSRVDVVAVSDKDSVQPVARTSARVVLADLPTTAKLVVTRGRDDAGQQQTTAEVTTSAPIAQVQAVLAEQPDRTVAGTYEARFLDLADLPTSTKVDVRHSRGRARVELTDSARISRLGAADVSVAGGQLTRAATAAALSLPTHAVVALDASVARTVEADYSAAQRVPTLDLSFYDRAAERTLFLGAVRDLPTQAHLSADATSQRAALTTDSSIGSLDAVLSQNDGGVFRPAGDHVTLLRNGDALGVSLRVTGVERATATFAAAPTVSAAFRPGGQPFLAAYADEVQLGVLSVTNLPAQLALALDTTARTATWRADAVVRQVGAFYARRDNSRAAVLTLDELPATIDLSWVLADATVVTSATSSRLAGLSLALYDRAAAETRVLATLQDVPTRAKVVADRTARHVVVELDGRLGLVQAQVQRALAPVAVDARDHATLITRAGGGLGASVLLHGLRGLDITVDDHPRGTVRTAPGGQPLLVAADLDGRTLARVEASNLPAELTFDIDAAAGKVGYRNSAAVDTLRAAYLVRGTGPTVVASLDRVPAVATATYVLGDHPVLTLEASGGLARGLVLASPDDLESGVDVTGSRYLAVDVAGVPAKVALDLDLPSRHVDWTASSPLSRVGFLTNGLGTVLGNRFLAGGTVVSVPAHWTADFGGGDYGFRGLTGPVGSVDLAFTNHGALTRYAGPHIAVHLDQPRGLLDASLVLPRISRAQYSRTGGAMSVDVDVDLGAQPLTVDADAVLSSGDRYSFRGSVVGLPSTLTATYGGGKLVYSADRSVDVTALVRAGRTAALAPLSLGYLSQGVAVVDGSCGSGCTGLLGTVNMRGLPRAVTVDAPNKKFSLTGYSGGTLQTYVDLDDVVSTPVRAFAVLTRLPSALDLTVGPISFTSPPKGANTLAVGYTASNPVGRLEVYAGYGQANGFALVDQLPKSVDVKGSFGSATDVTVDSSAPLSRLQLQVTDAPVGGQRPSAFVDLTGVPATMHLATSPVSKVQGIAVPDLTYRASDSTLSGTAFTDYRIAKKVAGAGFDADDLYLSTSRLAKAVTLTLGSDTSIDVASTPRTPRLQVGASVHLAAFRKAFTNDRNDPLKSYGPLAVTLVGRAGVDRVAIENALLTLDDLGKLHVEPGKNFLALGVDGDYGRFTLNTGGILIDPDTDLTFKVERPFGLPPVVNERLRLLDPTTSLVMRVSDQVFRDIRQPFQLKLGPLSAPVCFNVKTKPGPFAAYRNGVALRGADGPQTVNYLSPGGQTPSWMLDLATALYSHPFNPAGIAWGGLSLC